LTKIKPSTFLIILSIIIIAIYLVIAIFSNQKKFNQVKINNKTINVEIADTNAKREKGLSFHEPLSEDEGMLFIFDTPGRYGFWMKDMNFDLDFIWIKNNKIVEITSNVSHNNPGKVYQPKTEVDSVLEVKSGFAKRNQIKIGEQIKILTNTN
jgi:uncharacterized protein